MSLTSHSRRIDVEMTSCVYWAHPFAKNCSAIERFQLYLWQGGKLVHFLGSWEKLTKYQNLLPIIRGYQIPFLNVLEYFFFLKSKNTAFLHETMEKPYWNLHFKFHELFQ